MFFNTPIFHSQHGEDFLAWKLFRKQNPQTLFYVEVGALDGKRFSNTYTLEQLGWKGVCIEAHPEYYQYTKNNRPNAITIHAACSNTDADHITFHANDRGTLSAVEPLNETLLNDRFANYFNGYEPIQVPARTLTTMLDDSKAPSDIAVLSIDVEGHEMQVLQGIDFNRYNFRLIFIEAMEDEEAATTEAFLLGRGYHYARKIGGNLVFCKYQEDINRISDIQVTVPLLHTAHPHDAESSEKIIPPQNKSIFNIFKRSA